MIFDIDGNAIDSAYNIDGELVQAYDIDGEIVTEGTIRIMSYNVGEWYIGAGNPVPTAKKSEYLGLQETIFSKNKPDIVCLQEYDEIFCEDGTTVADAFLDDYLTSYETVGSDFRGHLMGTNAIVYSNYRSLPIQHAYTTVEACDLSIDGKTITLINVHFSYETNEQKLGVESLLDYIDNNISGSFIICGDFNTALYNVDKTNTQYINAVKPFIDRGYNLANFDDDRGWFKTYYGGDSGEYVDNIITSSDIKIANAFVDTSKLTDQIPDKIDHIPIFADIVFND